MKFDVLNRWTGAVQFTSEIDGASLDGANGMGAYEGGQLPGAINAATRIRTARAAVNDLAGETLAEFLADTLTVRFGKVKASLILRDALTGVEK